MKPAVEHAVRHGNVTMNVEVEAPSAAPPHPRLQRPIHPRRAGHPQHPALRSVGASVTSFLEMAGPACSRRA